MKCQIIGGKRVKNWRKRYTLRRAVPFLIFTAILSSLLYWHAFGYVCYKLIGRSECSWIETIRAVDYIKRYNAAARQIDSGHCLIQRDGDLQLWDVPGARPFWMPANFEKLNTIAFAEQVANNYWHPRVHIKAGDIVLDCGADYGGVTWRALSDGAEKVIAIEIDPAKISSLNRTFAKEIAEGRVIVVPLGLWDQDGSLELSGDSVVFERDRVKHRVRVTTLDKIVADLRLPRVDFIAMDIEGAEKPALRGAKNTLQDYHPRMAIAAEHYRDDAIAIPRLISELDNHYNVICGRCILVEYHVLPTVLFFEPR